MKLDTDVVLEQEIQHVLKHVAVQVSTEAGYTDGEERVKGQVTTGRESRRDTVSI